MIKTFTAMALPLGVLLLLLALYQNISAQTPEPGFASIVVSDDWNEVVGLTFTNDGVDMFVWERSGRVYAVTGGIKRLVLDISEEVGAWHDHGLLGFALHPQFAQNHYIYLLYVVDRHHLLNFGTGAYNPAVSEPSNATIGRLTRYTLNKSPSGIYSVAGGSRRILFGDQRSDGFILTERSHGAGSLVFGTDQTLLISAGDGANVLGQDRGSAAGTYFQQAIDDGIMTPALNVGAYRSQVLDCYNGKILRIDPETGEGIPSNPFYDPTRPNSPKSKVWALGFRNPFRMYLKPGSGSHNRADGNPGILYVGDVGFYSWEEIDVVDKPGMNFGWPMYEGLEQSVVYTVNTPNPFAPNPLFQVNGCSQQYFNFQNLIKQATPDGTAVFTNPCNGTQSIPSTIPTFVHSRPIIDWAHDAAGPSRTGTFSGQTATVANFGAPQFGGSAAVGGVYYTGSDFPEEYRNKLFIGDYGYRWIKSVALNDQEKPVQVRPFINSGAIVVGMATHPTQEGLYYVNFPSEIRRVIYSSNRPPVAVASANHVSGASPLNVQFEGDDSNDPEGLQLSYQWNFGDGSPLSNVANPAHTFTTSGTAPTQFTVTLKVTDNQGLQDQTTLIISVNNSPPNVTITSPLDGTLYPLTGETIYPLRATVTDLEHSASQLSYKWQTTLHHESHSHPEPVDTSPETTTHVSPLGCDGETYFVTISLTVTDDAGLSTTKTVTLYPDCGSQVKVTPVITWPNPAPIAVGTALGSTQLNATARHNGSTVAGTFVYTPPAGTVLGPGAGQQLSASFTPTNTALYNNASASVTIDVNQSGQSTFYRAININGSALVIDGNNWISSTGAPNFSFTTNRSVSANQNVTLVPPTDANRATMIRSFVWGTTVSLNMTAVPSGSYQVWVYVWEDNSPETYSISLEGSVVQSNFNSGPAGTWRKLGPYAVNITDGAINVSSSGGFVNFSGMEVWTAGPPPSNQPPVVANPIPNQNATVGVAYSYAFPSNTFSDPNAGTTLTYTATLDGGGSLPGWLTFTGSTRTFSGTPTLANLGSINIRVTASDGSGGTVSDVFGLNVTESGQSTFYRAININGTALVIDGNNWISSTGAPNFSFTTSNTVMANQGVTLIPPTDANRATMIRSSVYGSTVTLNMTAVPSGNYQVWLYVWEDNFAQTYSVSLEGSVVLSNFNSGPGGTWTKLGPYPVNITDGAINVSSSGGHANFSGIEVWTVGSPPSNQPPVVANPIVDQNATVGVAFSYAFPSNTFSDPNAGTTLTYTATLDGGGSLPGWLAFTGSTRTFSGTPTLANLGSINIRVTASDGSGGTVSDVFALNVTESGQSTFYRAININGPALVIDGNNWISSTGAPNFSFTTSNTVMANQGVTLIPPTDANRATMIRSSVYGSTVTLNMTAVPSGNYQVWLYVWEDNFAQTYSVSLEGAVVLSNFNSGPGGTWRKLGPYPVNITDGAINVSSSGGHANFSGIEVWTVGSPPSNQPPVVANPIVDQNATVGVAFSYAFPSNTFSDPNAGTTLTYTATLDGGGSLPGWLTFTGSTRTFSGTPTLANLGSINIRVTASDGSGGTVSDVFALNVTESGQSTFYRAININGTALVIDGNNWISSTGAPNFSFTTNNITFSNQGITLVPPTDANRATMIRSSVYGSTVTLNMTAVPSGNYQVWLYVWEDNFAETYSISLEGSLVQSNFTSGPAGAWTKLGPYPVNITDGAINVSSSGGHANISGIEVWTGTSGAAARLAATASTTTLAEETLDNSAALEANPNPFSTKLNVRFTARQSANARVELFDMQGRSVHLLYSGKMSVGETKEKELETSELPDGIYILQFVNGKHITRLKLMGAQ